jgi:hypothetical protein
MNEIKKIILKRKCENCNQIVESSKHQKHTEKCKKMKIEDVNIISNIINPDHKDSFEIKNDISIKKEEETLNINEFLNKLFEKNKIK